MEKIVKSIKEQINSGKNAVLVTIVEQAGSAPRGQGTQMLVGDDGLLAGTVGGGAIEARAIAKARELIKTQEAALISYDLSGANKADLGMVCGGGVSLLFAPLSAEDEAACLLADTLEQSLQNNIPGYLRQSLSDGSISLLDEKGNVLAGKGTAAEVKDIGYSGKTQGDCFIMPIPLKQRVILCGGGHVAQSLVPVLTGLDFRVTVVESRREFARQELFPTAEKVQLVDYTKLAQYIDLQADDFIIIMTHGHIHDYILQEQLLRDEYAYIGVMGSRRKIAAVNEKLTAAGISKEAMESVHTPIGVAIGAVTPAEIAISVAAECIAVRAQRRKMTEGSCPSTL
ncbi:MAG: xanthine dehydrogenase accessory protein XdhC [Selenomonadaceae bacterium]|nr:xanthine dehydrogenase accessory protein XdhC [Selenomonadaceae bacterium]